MPTPFGDISVPNITPDVSTGIGAWTDEDFYRAMHEGVGRNHEYLYPVFPFPWFTKVTREDVLAIEAYLRSVPAVTAPRAPMKLSWPARERETLAGWRAAFFTAGEYKADATLSPAANRGAYLVQGLGHCGECHNQHNVVGVSRWSGSLEGGQIEGWFAPNLTSDRQQGVGSWSEAEIAGFLKTGASPHGGMALGPMQEVVDRSLSHLTSADLLAIGAYLKSVPPKEAYRQSVAAAPTEAEGGTYLTFCASCHGVKGQGVVKQIPALKSDGALTAEGAQNVIRVVLGGLPASRGLAPMPAVGVQMTDQQVGDAVDYVRNAFGNAAPASAASGLVGQIREQTQTTLAGNPLNGCPKVDDPKIARVFAANEVAARLARMTDTSMLSVLDTLLPKLRAVDTSVSQDDLVNALTDAYCATLAKRNLSQPARAARLGNFSVLAYGQLKYPSHG